VLSGCVAVAGLFIVPYQQTLAAWQYADVPLACLYLAALVAIAFGVKADSNRPWAVLAGLFAGAALWTKNEGVLFAVSALLVDSVSGYSRETVALRGFAWGSCWRGPYPSCVPDRDDALDRRAE
jgi:Dolichyl-phosphate-mannose-protein mannosyltransferase